MNIENRLARVEARRRKPDPGAQGMIFTACGWMKREDFLAQVVATRVGHPATDVVVDDASDSASEAPNSDAPPSNTPQPLADYRDRGGSDGLRLQTIAVSPHEFVEQSTRRLRAAPPLNSTHRI